MDHDRNIIDFIEVDDRREPVGREIARIGNDKECSHHFFPDEEVFRGDLDRRRCENITQIEVGRGEDVGGQY